MKTIYSELYHIEQHGTSAALCTLIESSGSTPRKAGSKMIVYPDQKIVGTIGGGSLEHMVILEAVASLSANKSGIFEYNLTQDAGMACGGHAKVFIEPIESKKPLYIFGAGHIGSFLAQVSNMLGFSVTLIDERDGIFNTPLPDSIKTINLGYEEAFKLIDFNPNCFICVMTHNHTNDKDIVAHCAKQPFAYLGMIGSKSKIATLKKSFTENNQLTTKEMNRINWPIGIDINCQTPEEIAVSVLAKLVDVRSLMNPKLK